MQARVNRVQGSVCVFICGVVLCFFLCCDNLCAQDSNYLKHALENENHLSTQNTQDNVSIASVLIRLSFSLCIVIGLMILFAYMFKKFIGKGNLSLKPGLIRVISAEYIAPKKMIYIVDIAGEILVLACDSSSLRFLTKITDEKVKVILSSQTKKTVTQNKGFLKIFSSAVQDFTTNKTSIQMNNSKDENFQKDNAIKDIAKQIKKLKQLRNG
ncbi:MAG: hypothetical protein DRP78_03445 [Candidatus Omnitrophota bacterium]|nr:MAG: hypothetical protein DRP78_03445 [Candidatus Omnitrophota bacterium]